MTPRKPRAALPHFLFLATRDATSAPALRWDYWMLLGRDVPSSSTGG